MIHTFLTVGLGFFICAGLLIFGIILGVSCKFSRDFILTMGSINYIFYERFLKEKHPDQLKQNFHEFYKWKEEKIKSKFLKTLDKLFN